MPPGPRSFFTTGARELLHPPRTTIGGLDFLRTAAILLVISGHVAGDYARRHGHFWLEKLPIFDLGWTGVDLFFVLSGYLIGRQLWKELRETGSIDVPAFLIRRGMRIWPYYFCFLTVMALVVDHGRPLSRALPDLLFFSNYVNGIVGGGWSLSTEEQFYLLAPLLLLLIRPLTPARRYLPLVAILALLPVIRLATYVAWRNGGGELPPPEMVLLSPFHTHADGLLLGLVLAWLSVTIPTMTAPRTLSANLPLTVTLAVAGVILRQIDKNAFAFTGLALLYGAMTLFILRDNGATTRWTSFRGFHVISRLSYGMYLNHFLILSRLPGWFGDRPMLNAAGRSLGYAHAFSTAQFAPLVVGTIASSAVLAFVSFCLVERPFLLLRDSWLKTRETKQLARPDVETASV